ncbi:MAG: hypothetical protein J7539_10460 [Niabella sp.]|nr:hypothetical protein [Niabella sp.]
MKKITLIVLSAISLASCGLNQKKAVDYNNGLVKIQQEAALAVVNAENQIGAAITAKDSAKAIQLMDDAAAKVDGYQKQIDSLKFDGDDFGMKAALNETIAFMKNFYGVTYKKWLGIQFSPDPTPADQQTAQALLTESQKGGGDLDKKFLQAQQQFAKSHNIKLIQQNFVK